jgi:hypothetical protein
MILPTYSSAASVDTGTYSAKLQSFDVDEFTYRISFQLEDGTESFLIRSRFGLTYLYQHHQPTVSQHHMWGVLGFYYGKTALGRNIIANITFDSMAFFPILQGADGIYHDFKDERALFERVGWIPDGYKLGGNMLLDDLAISKVAHMFGGTLVIKNLVLDLDGEEVEMGDIEIKITKHYNENDPYAAEMESEQDLTYRSDVTNLIAIGEGMAPFLVSLDGVLSILIFGALIMFVALLLLHVKGMIRLPFHKIGRFFARLWNSSE